MKKLLSLILVVTSFAAVLGGCGVSTLSPPPTSSSGAGTITASFILVMLSPSTIANGGTTTVTATVTDASARVVPNVSVSFSVTGSAGSFAPVTQVTDASGQATSVFTALPLGNDSTATIRASITVGTTTINGGATITIGTPPLIPSSIAVSCTPSPILSSGTTTVSATVLSGVTPVSGATVNFTVGDVPPGSSGSLSAASALTNASGIATVSFTANAVDMFVDITAAVGTLTSTTNLTIGSPPPPVPANLAIDISPLTIDIQQTATVTVTAKDSTGALAKNASIDFSFTLGGTIGSFSASDQTIDTISQTTDVNGQAIVTFYAGGTSGPVTIKAAATAAPTVSKTASLSITSMPNDISVTASPSVINTLGTSSIKATVANRLGLPVGDGTLVSFTIFAGPAGAGTIDATATTVNGVATATFTASATVTGDVIISASAGSSPNIVTGTVLVSIKAAATSSLEFVSAVPVDIGVIGSGKQDYSIVTFMVKDSNGTPQGGVLVDFQLFGPTNSYIGSTPGSVTDQQSTISSGTNQGKAATILHAGTVPGPARIVASVTLGTPPSTTTITTSSGNIAIGGALPSDNHFSIAAARFNLPGFLTCYGETTDISVFLADRYGNYNILTGTQVSFIPEAAEMDTSAQTDATGYAKSQFRTTGPEPVDVAPDGWEVASGLTYTDGTGRVRNPRDGWTTILAMTTGEETFVDYNGNGFYDGVDTFTDVGEPFVDVDDTNAWLSGERFFNWPSYVPLLSGCTTTCGPTQYDGGNGVWDQKIPIWKKITLVLTGAADAGPYTSHILSSIGTGTVTIAKDTSAIFWVTVSDINMNTPAGGTTITMSASDSGATITIPSGADKILDGLSTGPYTFPVTVKNSISGTSSVGITLTAAVKVPTTCGDRVTQYNYPGTITLTP